MANFAPVRSVVHLFLAVVLLSFGTAQPLHAYALSAVLPKAPSNAILDNSSESAYPAENPSFNPEMRNGLLCGNDPVNKTDPMGLEHVQEPGFTKPLSEVGDWSQAPWPVSGSFYAIGGLLTLGGGGIAAEAGASRVITGLAVRYAVPGTLAARLLTPATQQALGKTANNPGAPLTATMRLGLKVNAAQAQRVIDAAKQSMSPKGTPLSLESAARNIETMQKRIDLIQKTLEGGKQLHGK